MAKLLFLQNIEYEFIGPTYLSSWLKANGHECRMAIGSGAGDFAPEIGRFKPDLVGFSTMTGSHEWAIRIAGEIKAGYGIPNIFGGPHPTYFPKMINEKNVDMLVRGEGEEALLEIMDSVDRGATPEGIANLSYKTPSGRAIENDVRPLAQDLDVYPFPDWHLYDSLEGKIDRSIRTVITSRGCPYRCTFCFQDTMRQLYKGKGRYVRIRSIDKVIEECKKLQEEVDVKRIYIRDDVFGTNTKWLYEFLDRYKREVGIEFMCLVRADRVAADEQYARRMADAGCKLVFWGIESGSEDIRNRILGKGLYDRDIKKAARHLHDAGIKFMTFNILGLPDETLQDAFSTVELNIEIKTDYPWCSLFLPLPGTKLTEYAVSRGYLDEEYLFLSPQGTFYDSSLMKMQDIDRITNLQRFFQTSVLFPWIFPLIKRLIRIRPNFVFKWWFALVYFYIHLKSERRSLFTTLKFAARNYRHLLGGGKKKSR